MSTIIFELPDDLVGRLGSPETVASQAKQALVLQLLRDAQVSQGRAARLLGLNHADILDLMAAFQIPSGPSTESELEVESQNIERFLRSPAHLVLPLLQSGLDEGESEAIALAGALSRPDIPILLDDLPARRIALDLGFNVIGSAGITTD